MQMTAILETGGKQYRVAEGDIIYAEKLTAEEGSDISFDTVVAVFEDGKIKTGDPYVAGVTVTAAVIKNGKAKKIIVYKMKPKKNYRRKQGHRQPYTKLQIKSIALPKEKAPAAPKADAAPKKPAASKAETTPKAAAAPKKAPAPKAPKAEAKGEE
jgi:large subunit ribosomal protein L21